MDSGYLKARGKYHKLEKSFEGQWNTAASERKAEMARELRRARNEMFAHPYYAQCNSNYKCLHYCRYADDFIISVIGSKQDAEQIKADVKDFLANALKLELSEEKTKVTHSSDFARFLGYDICISHSDAIQDNCQDTIFGGFAPNSKTAEELSRSLGSYTVQSGSISRSKGENSQSLQMAERALQHCQVMNSNFQKNYTTFVA